MLALREQLKDLRVAEQNIIKTRKAMYETIENHVKSKEEFFDIMLKVGDESLVTIGVKSCLQELPVAEAHCLVKNWYKPDKYNPMPDKWTGRLGREIFIELYHG